MRDVLVIVAADPRSSGRGLEALRMSVGLALAGNRVRLHLLEAARALADPERFAFAGWPDAVEHLAAFRSLGGEILDEGPLMERVEEARTVIRWNP